MSDVCFGIFWATRNMSSIFEALHLVQHSAATTLLEHENHREKHDTFGNLMKETPTKKGCPYLVVVARVVNMILHIVYIHMNILSCIPCMDVP